MQETVRIDREKYIGGSDVAAVMGFSPFKTRWELLQEKAGIIETVFGGNEYTEYGNAMEGEIRDYLNAEDNYFFAEDVRIDGYMRYHADGYDKNAEVVLEIKTTSRKIESLDDCTDYLVQLLTGMKMFEASEGFLAVYSRPEDFSEEFDPERLKVFRVSMAEFERLAEAIFKCCERFWGDLERLKENPFITEEELQPKAIQKIADKVLALEAQLAEYKELEREQKKLKDALYVSMVQYGIKKWTTQGGVQITLIPDSEGKRKKALNEEALKAAEPELYEKFSEEVETAGRKGYVKITFPK